MRVGAAFIQTLASQLGQSLASIATGVLIARGLGPAGQGRYATFAAGVAIGAVVASLGQFHGNVLAAAHQRAPPRVLLVRACVYGLALLTLAWAVLAAVGRLLGPDWRGTLAFLFALVLSLEASAQMIGGINLGRHHVTGWNVASLTQRFAYFALVAGLAVGAGWRLEFVATCWAVATSLSVLAAAIWVWRNSDPTPIGIAQIRTGWGERLAQGLRAFVTIVLTLFLVRADIWMLRPWLGVATVGQVSVATYLAEWLWYIPSILGNLLFAAVAASRGGETISQVARSARLVAGLLVPVTIVLLLVGKQLVATLYGPAYGEAGLLFLLLLPGTAALGLHLVLDAYFAGSGFPPITLWGAFGAVVAKVVLNVFAVPRWGVVGAVAATSVVYGALLVLKMLGFRRTTGVAWRDLVFPNRSDFVYIRERAIAMRRA